MEWFLNNLIISIPSVIMLLVGLWMLTLRRIVPPNMVHIVQRGTKTVSYGVGKRSNVYYAFPSWIPRVGITVRKLPVTNFDVELKGYSAYDIKRVPFLVDIKAFFHIEDTNVAANKIDSFDHLKDQLLDIVRGAVRSILAQSDLESIMEERSKFGKQFTDAVKDDLLHWGVTAVKSIELMDVRDAADEQVIEQIMEKRKSEISKESRIEVAKNMQEAEEAELEARKQVSVKQADTQRESGEAQAKSQEAVNIANATTMKNSGIAQQQAQTEVHKAAQTTKTEEMKVVRVETVEQAQITKEAAIVTQEQEKKQTEIAADAEKYRIEVSAGAQLEAKKKHAEGVKEVGNAEASVAEAKGMADAKVIKATGLSTAEGEKASQLASVAAQVEFAEKVGENQPYQDYLIRLKGVEVAGDVGKVQYTELAKALQDADLKLLVNSGDVESGMSKISDIFTSKGGSQLNGLMEALGQTEEGQGLLSLLRNLGKGESLLGSDTTSATDIVEE
jgi:flotillin